MTVTEQRKTQLPVVGPTWVARASTLARHVLSVLPDPKRTPLTFGYLMVLLATTITQYLVPDSTLDRIFEESSTNLANLASRPVEVLLLSAGWLTDKDWLGYALAFTLALAPLERRLGVLRAAGIVLTGHVLVTLITEGGVGLAITLGRMPASVEVQWDIGASYLLMTGIGAVLGLLPVSVRVPALGVAALCLALPVLGNPGMTDIGHLLCLATGVCFWPMLRRRGLLGTMWPGRRPWHPAR